MTILLSLIVFGLIALFISTWIYGLKSSRAILFESLPEKRRHKMRAYLFSVILLLLVVVIEISVIFGWLNIPSKNIVSIFGIELGIENSLLLCFHIPLAIVFSILITICLFKINGEKQPLWHKKIVRWIMWFGLSTLLTGIILFMQAI